MEKYTQEFSSNTGCGIAAAQQLDTSIGSGS